jgi:threonyl-tRNA synthetase
MIAFINNNELKIKANIQLKILTTKNTVCFSINDIINEFNKAVTTNISILLLSLNNVKILNILRHSCAHLMAHAINKLYKNIKYAIGPIIKNGFYYDFFINKKINNEDLFLIEKEMKSIVKQKINIIKYKILLKNSKKLFKNNKYKSEIINNISQTKISIYKQNDFIDLCLGPHVKNTKFLKYFKLIKISGAYWKNNNKNDMLHRIYGTLWTSKKELDCFLNNNKNIVLLDHKKLGSILNLFCFDEYSQGVIFWNKNGWFLYRRILKYLRDFILKNKFNEVNTPTLLNSSLFQKSGHIEKFNEYMFIFENKNISEILKPMNCPCHINVFNHFKTKSYKDLPYRLSEFGLCFRNELSGSLYGLMRLKNFTQDDGHIFCSEIHIYDEIINFITDLKKVYYNFGFHIFKVTLAKKPKNINDNLTQWEQAEIFLEKTIKKMNIKYETSHDGAFYGPKIEFSLKDNLDRYWQCGTIQVDFFSAKRLNAYYTNADGILTTPVILHRAILGSIERFLGILIENNKGMIPFWINPTQFEILYINDAYLKYAKKIYNVIIREYTIKLNLINERLDYKVKKCILEKIPYIIIVGDYEKKNKTLTIRSTKSNKFVKLTFNKFIRNIKLKKNKGVYY